MDTGSIIPSWARVGAKVVAVGGGGPSAESRGFKVETWPALKAVYTIRDILDSAEPCIRLTEIRVAGLWPDGREFYDAWLYLRSFRPLVARSLEADVSRFRNDLRVKRNKADAVVRIPHLGTIGK